MVDYWFGQGKVADVWMLTVTGAVDGLALGGCRDSSYLTSWYSGIIDFFYIPSKNSIAQARSNCSSDVAVITHQ
jgi:hypothetical protein